LGKAPDFVANGFDDHNRLGLKKRFFSPFFACQLSCFSEISVDKRHSSSPAESIPRFHFSDWVPFPVERVFLFFANPENLPRIMPPSTGTRIDALRLVPPTTQPTSITQPVAGLGSEIVTSFRILPFLGIRATWIAQITEFEWNHHFADVQVEGPFRIWRHRHALRRETRHEVEGTVVTDEIECQVGLGVIGRLVLRFVLANQIENTFAFRQNVLPRLLAEK
jgi:ligand-binding SRPBCC domain-containing protein